MSSRSTQFGNEVGLLGLAFHPDYATPGAVGEGKFYVFYNPKGSFDPVVSQFSVSQDPNRADPVETIIMGPLEHSFINHYGGMLAFNPSDDCRSCLYISHGDGGHIGDPLGNAQNLENTMGSILRIDVDSPSKGLNYGIPEDNPLVGHGGLDEIWAYGLRAPWRFSFDRADGRGFVGDFSGTILSTKEIADGEWEAPSVRKERTFPISSFAEDEEGELCVVDLTGSVYRIVDTTQPYPDGDLTEDWRVEPDDLLEFIDQARGTSASQTKTSADINGDHEVDFLDALLLGANWRK